MFRKEKRGDVAHSDKDLEPVAGPDRDERHAVNRRHMLRLGGMATAAAAAATVAAAAPAGATTGSMQYGAVNNAGTDLTELDSSNERVMSFVNLNGGTGGGVGLAAGSVSGTGIWASGHRSGLFAQSASESAVLALADGNTAFEATDTLDNYQVTSAHSETVLGAGTALHAHLDQSTNSSDAVVVSTVGTGSAVIATATSAGWGVKGQSGDPSAIAGVSGVRGDSSAGTGVFGTSDSAIGVRGIVGDYSGLAVGNAGVIGEANSAGVGLVGASPSGTAVKAITTDGTALDVHGKAKFTRSGVLSIAAGASSATTPVAIPGGLTTASHVLATLQTNAGAVVVKSAVPNTSTGKITVNLSAAAPTGGVKVAYLVIG